VHVVVGFSLFTLVGVKGQLEVVTLDPLTGGDDPRYGVIGNRTMPASRELSQGWSREFASGSKLSVQFLRAFSDEPFQRFKNSRAF
jgi:hypothetical protein